MNPKIKGVAILLMTLLLGFGLGYLLHDALMFPPSDHQAVIDVFTVKCESYILDRTFLKSGKSTWTLSVLTDNFGQGNTYTYSLWMFSYKDDPELYVCVWGPGDDGHTYQVEFCAAWSPRFYTITWLGNTETFQNNIIVPIVTY